MGDVVKDHQLLSLNDMLHACTRHITIQLDPSIRQAGLASSVKGVLAT